MCNNCKLLHTAATFDPKRAPELAGLMALQQQIKQNQIFSYNAENMRTQLLFRARIYGKLDWANLVGTPEAVKLTRWLVWIVQGQGLN